MPSNNTFNTRATLTSGSKSYTIYSLPALATAGGYNLSRLPFSIKILLENLLRQEDERNVRRADIDYVAQWNPTAEKQEIAFMPARVLMQDFTGVPCVVDVATMRDALKDMGADPTLANPLIPVDLVIDHSVQVDHFGQKDSFDLNVLLEFQRNHERYALLRWAQANLRNFRAVPPGTGIVHQVNLEYLAPVVFTNAETGEAYPDTLVGTDSHTTMINGLGVVGWGVGGIEAEACMLGQPCTMLLPDVVGFKLTGTLAPGATATDLVLMVTQMLRKKGVVGKFVEFYGPGVKALSLADRATIANMAPEYGATIGFFPIDEKSLDYLRLTNRPAEQIQLVEDYCRAQGLFLTADTPDPVFSDSLELDLAKVVPSLAGPKRPQDRIDLNGVKANFLTSLGAEPKSAPVTMDGQSFELRDGAVAIAAITSCTNTSNPSVLMAAGLLAKKAVALGLTVKPWVKTSLAPGSKVVTDYLIDAGLMPHLEALKFHLVGYGCTTCIGNSGPLPDPIAEAVTTHKLNVAAVLSGNRNFEGRVNPHVRSNYLASPPLCVAYAIAGRVDLDLTTEPIGTGSNGQPVYLADIWPTGDEIEAAVRQFVTTAQFKKQYDSVFEGTDQWRSMKVPTGDQFAWDPQSTYIRRPPYFENMADPSNSVKDFAGLQCLAVLGDSITTDHISPAGNIAKNSPAAQYLNAEGVAPVDFNSYGARRGNHEVMIRGTFANIRIKNAMLDGVEGPYTKHAGEQKFIYDAAMANMAAGIGQVIIAGKEYGSGSSRDWAAKGTNLLGVKAVIAESFERIHRSNLVGMGVLPCVFLEGQNRESLGLTGFETFDISGVVAAVNTNGASLATVTATAPGGEKKTFSVKVRIDTPVEAEYYRYGGILPFVLRQVAASAVKA